MAVTGVGSPAGGLWTLVGSLLGSGGVQNRGRDSAAETSQCWRPREKGAGIWCGAMLGRQSWKEKHWMKLMLTIQEDLLWSV
ncbi:unnamed protein product [Boreogadus saida]